MVSYWQVVQLPPVPGNLVERTYIASLTPGVEYAIFIQVVVYRVLLHNVGFLERLERLQQQNGVCVTKKLCQIMIYLYKTAL
jgi:hypothetical protein